jgi:hypothetical protein
MEPRPGHVGLLRDPIDVEGWVARIHLERSSIKTETTGFVKFADRCLGTDWPVTMRRVVWMADPPRPQQSAVVGRIMNAMAGDVQRDATELGDRRTQ